MDNDFVVSSYVSIRTRRDGGGWEVRDLKQRLQPCSELDVYKVVHSDFILEGLFIGVG